MPSRATAAARSAPSSSGTRRWRRGLTKDAEICCGATPTRSATTACSFRTPNDGCTVTVPRSSLCSRQFEQEEPRERRMIRVVQATGEGLYTDERWSQLQFWGRCVRHLRNDVARHLNLPLSPAFVMCVRAGRHGRLTPLVVHLPHDGSGETLDVVVMLSGTPGMASEGSQFDAKNYDSKMQELLHWKVRDAIDAGPVRLSRFV